MSLEKKMASGLIGEPVNPMEPSAGRRRAGSDGRPRRRRDHLPAPRHRGCPGSTAPSTRVRSRAAASGSRRSPTGAPRRSPRRRPRRLARGASRGSCRREAGPPGHVLRRAGVRGVVEPDPDDGRVARFDGRFRQTLGGAASRSSGLTTSSMPRQSTPLAAATSRSTPRVTIPVRARGKRRSEPQARRAPTTSSRARPLYTRPAMGDVGEGVQVRDPKAMGRDLEHVLCRLHARGRRKHPVDHGVVTPGLQLAGERDRDPVAHGGRCLPSLADRR